MRFAEKSGKDTIKMKLGSQLTYIFILILFTGTMVTMVTPALGSERSEEAIAHWVADRMGLTQPFDMPTMHYVDKATLGSVFREGSQQTYSSWQEEYGEDEAQKILEGYLDEIVGLFSEATLSIYVANFIESCRQEAILAHEMVHYFQHLMEGIIEAGSWGEHDERLIREMQAYHIQEIYITAFCGKDKDTAQDPEADPIES
jgi:hypothetical protein